MSNATCGTLNDVEIKSLLESGKLIVENCDKNNVKQACYELRAGNIYFDLTSGGTKHTVEDKKDIVFKPHQSIVIITKEKLKIPNDILARVLTKGSLFSVGFNPVNTYADPGFHGQMGIVMNNSSNNYLKIKSGDVIAKIEFDRLQNEVDTPYFGQHSFESGVWPIRSDYVIDRNDIKKYISQYDEMDEIKSVYGESIANIMHRVLISEKRFLFATIVLIITNLLIIGLSQGTNWIDPVTSVILGILSNLGYTIVSFFIKNYNSRRK